MTLPDVEYYFIYFGVPQFAAAAKRAGLSAAIFLRLFNLKKS